MNDPTDIQGKRIRVGDRVVTSVQFRSTDIKIGVVTNIDKFVEVKYDVGSHRFRIVSTHHKLAIIDD